MLINSKLFNSLKIASFLLFVFALVQILTSLKIKLYDSEWLFMYSCCILGAVLGFAGNINKDTTLIINKLGKISAYGNLMLAILFFPPLYFIWGTFLESIISGLK